MKVSSLRYLIKEGVKNLWKNRVMAFTSIGVLTTCLVIVGAAYLITANVSSMVSFVETQSEMSVFLQDFAKPDIVTDKTSVDIENENNTANADGTATEPTNDENGEPVEGEQADSEALAEEIARQKEEYRQAMVAEIKGKIEAIENVATMEYISKEQGLEDTREMLGAEGYLIDGIKDRNYIPDTFVLTVKDLSLTAQTQELIQSIEGVELVKASTEVSDTLIYVQRTVNTLGSGIILALAVISTVIISNTIRATIFARRKEINIMKFVGATNSFIRVPFVVEGFMLGLISAVLSYFIIWGAYSYLIQSIDAGFSAWLSSVFANIIPFSDISLNLMLFFGATGTILGSIGSFISIRNHVKV